MIIGIISLLYGILKLSIFYTNRIYIFNVINSYNLKQSIKNRMFDLLLFDSLLTFISGLTILLI